MGFFTSKKNKETIVVSPITGEVKGIEHAPDAVFAQKMMGDGVVLFPKDGVVKSPITGNVEMIFPTLHAIGLKSDDGVEVLIHYGTDTNSLEGKPFDVKVEVGQKVKAGDLLMNVDIEYIQEKSLSTATPMVFTSLSEDKIIELLKSGEVEAGEEIIRIK